MSNLSIQLNDRNFNFKINKWSEAIEQLSFVEYILSFIKSIQKLGYFFQKKSRNYCPFDARPIQIIKKNVMKLMLICICFKIIFLQ